MLGIGKNKNKHVRLFHRNYLPFESQKITEKHVLTHFGRELGREPIDDMEISKELDEMLRIKKDCKEWMGGVLRRQIFENARQVNMKDTDGELVSNFQEVGSSYIGAPLEDKEKLAAQVHWAFYGWFSLQKDYHMWLEKEYLAYKGYAYKQEAKKEGRRKHKGFIGDICKAKRNEIVNSFKRKCLKSKSGLYVKDSGHMESGEDGGKKVQGTRREMGRFYTDYQTKQEAPVSKQEPTISVYSVGQELINASKNVFFEKALKEEYPDRASGMYSNGGLGWHYMCVCVFHTTLMSLHTSCHSSSS